MLLRREPFRALFPLAALLAWVGVLPWLLFGSGVIQKWLGAYHALTMTQGFLVAVAVGFLGTMIPRRTQTPPLSAVELGLIVLGLAAVPAALLLDSLLAAELAYLGVLGTLLQFLVRRLRARTAAPPAPASFVLLPIGVLSGTGGAALVIFYVLSDDHAWALALGRNLTQQGMLLGLVLAVAPMLGPILARGRAASPAPGPRLTLLRLGHVALGLGLLGSFAVEQWLSVGLGLGLRGGCVAIGLIAPLLAPAERTSVHRSLFRLSLLMLPLGLLAAGINPAQRVPFLHLTFVGGFALMVMAVSIHVTLLHSGQAAQAERNPWPVPVIGLLVVAAAVLRVAADHYPRHYFGTLTLAAALWLTAGAVWAVFLACRVTRGEEAAA